MNAVSASKHKEDFLFSALNKGLAEDVNKEKNRLSSIFRINFFGTWTLKRYYKKKAKHRSDFSNLRRGCEVKTCKYFPEAQKTAE